MTLRDITDQELEELDKVLEEWDKRTEAGSPSFTRAYMRKYRRLITNTSYRGARVGAEALGLTHDQESQLYALLCSVLAEAAYLLERQTEEVPV